MEANMGTKKIRQRHALAIAVPAVTGRLVDLDRVVSEAEAAEIIGYSKHTLRREFPRRKSSCTRAFVRSAHRLPT
jgi:hypothetical protein